MHETFERSYDAPRSSERAFGLVMAAALGLTAAAPLRHGLPVRWWALALAALFAAASLIRPAVLKPFNVAWFRLGLGLGRVSSVILLAVVFFAAVAPIGLLLRALGRRPMRLARDAAATTYWIERTPPGPPPPTMIRQF